MTYHNDYGFSHLNGYELFLIRREGKRDIIEGAFFANQSQRADDLAKQDRRLRVVTNPNFSSWEKLWFGC